MKFPQRIRMCKSIVKLEAFLEFGLDKNKRAWEDEGLFGLLQRKIDNLHLILDNDENKY